MKINYYLIVISVIMVVSLIIVFKFSEYYEKGIVKLSNIPVRGGVFEAVKIEGVTENRKWRLEAKFLFVGQDKFTLKNTRFYSDDIELFANETFFYPQASMFCSNSSFLVVSSNYKILGEKFCFYLNDFILKVEKLYEMVVF